MTEQPEEFDNTEGTANFLSAITSAVGLLDQLDSKESERFLGYLEIALESQLTSLGLVSTDTTRLAAEKQLLLLKAWICRFRDSGKYPVRLDQLP